MIIWLASYPRSGNTFLRVVLNSVFHVRTYSIYDDRSDIGADDTLSEVVGHEFLPHDFDLEQARRSEKPYFIKTHDGPAQSLDDKVIYLLRDGRASTLSFRRYLLDYQDHSISLRDLIRGRHTFGAWGQHVSAWNPAGRKNTLLVHFEELIADPLAVADAVARFTGLKPVSAEIPTFQELHEKGPRFFRSGKTDAWKSEYSPSDHCAFWLKNHRQMIEYGYCDDMPELFERTPELATMLQVLAAEQEYALGQALARLSRIDDRITRLQNLSETIERKMEHPSSKESKRTPVAQPEYRSLPAKDSEITDFAESANAQGEGCYRAGKLDEAQELFLQAIQRDPGCTDGYNNLGVLAWSRGDAAGALEFFATGLRLDPDHRDLIINTAEVLKTLGKPGDAAALYEGYLQRNPADDVILTMFTEPGAPAPQSTPQDSGCPIGAGRSDVDTDIERGEKAYQAGDVAAAEQHFDKAYASNPAKVEVCNNLAVLHWQAGNVEKALRYLAEAVELDPRHRDVVVNAGQILTALQQLTDAEALYTAYLRSHPQDTEVSELLSLLGDKLNQVAHGGDGPGPGTDVREPAAQPVQDTSAELPPHSAASAIPAETRVTERPSAETGGRVTIATSIAPKDLAKQKRAIQSWLDLGFEVLSLNVDRELKRLQPEFPGVRFVCARRNGSKLAGKPYVFVDDVMAALKQAGGEIVGIVNSDIMLRSGSRLLDDLSREAAGCLLYGSRVDVENIEDSEGRLYHRGFDFFFFDRKIIDQLAKTSFMLGVPWWDYWLPYAVMERGVPVKRIETPLAYHLRHAINYNLDHLVRFGEEFVARCGDAPFVGLYRQCAGQSFEKGSFSVLSDGALDYLARHSERLCLHQPLPACADAELRQADRPKISAIVSTYNSESHIAECLSDLVNQTIADQLEIVIIDAASPQNERAVVEGFQARFPNIRYRRTPTRIGIYAAWNMAAKLARGDYLITCSTNDRLRPDACEILARTLDEHPHVSLVYGNSFLSRVPHQTFDQATLCGLYLWPGFSYENLLDHCMVGPHPMWRRSVHDDIGYFDEQFVALGDQDFWLRLAERHKLLNVPDFTGLYYVSQESITGDTDLTRVEADRLHSHYGWRYRYGKWIAERGRRAVPGSGAAEGPLTRFFVLAMHTDDEMLADTLDSIANQSYQNWCLTVISDRPCPDALFQEEPRLAWFQSVEQETALAALDLLVEQDAVSEWFCLFDAGDQLEPGFLSDVHRYLAGHPEWKLVYTDHDLVDGRGDLSEPRFKPDWNLELFRCTDYIGNSVVVSRSALVEAGGFGVYQRAAHYDLVLRSHDRFGGDSIGHVADLLSHRCVIHEQNRDEQSVHQRRRALEEHLQRCGLTALVTDGLSAGSFMLDYQPAKLPKVSILIEASGSMATLAGCLRSVFGKTDYPSFDVCVAVSGDALDDSRDQLEKLVVPDARLKLVPGGQALQHADGEYLVCMKQEMVVLQSNWLQRLVQLGTGDDVGAVGARAVDHRKTVVDAGIMLGTGRDGVGVRCHQGLHMTSPGYMGRAQVAQEVSAVSGLCMLVSKAVFEAAGGYDGGLSVDLYRAIDLCQRIRRLGKRIIWTPYSTLMYLGSPDEFDGKDEGGAWCKHEADLMYQRWLPELTADPSYNRNLSRERSDMAVEAHIVPGWDPEVDTAPRVIGFGVGSYGSWQHRVKQPLEVMAREGVLMRTHAPFCGRQKVRLPSPAEIEAMQPQSLLMHNALHDEYIEAMERYKRANKACIVFGQDDLMTALPPSNPFFRFAYKDMKRRIRKCLALADRVLVTTEPLADALRGMTDDIRVVPNYLDATVWGALRTRRGVSAKPRVGWAGAQQHLGDLLLLEEVVRETAGEVDWVFFGMCPDFLLPYVKEVHEPVQFGDYPAKLATLDLDIALAPLERNKFNEAKSNLRVLEYGSLGWSVIASDIEPYRDAPVTRVPNQSRAWINAIRERIDDPDTARREGDRLREWVRHHWMLQQHLDEWLRVLDPLAGAECDAPLRNRLASPA
jgi:GT2 family glycosyltransferase/tetratricopeptide (TPR) repeat protein